MQTSPAPEEVGLGGLGGRLDLSRIAQDLQIRKVQVEAVVQLLDEGNTIPFITRYRKERTGGLDEEVLRIIQERVALLRQLAERKQTILKSIDGQNKLTDELRSAILAADNPKRLEDLYLPYKPKKRTLATAAREKGLEPLALSIWSRDPAVNNLDELLPQMVNTEKELATVEDVKAGVQYILAEVIAEAADVRAGIRAVLWDTGKLTTAKSDKLAEGQGLDYKDYFQFSEPIRHIPPHRILAINRGEKENALVVKFEWDTATGQRVAEERLPLPMPEAATPEPVAAAPTPIAGAPTDQPAEAPPSPPLGEPPAQEAAPPVPPSQRHQERHGPHGRPPRGGRHEPHVPRGEALRLHPHAEFLKVISADALSRLLVPSLEREIRRELTQRAEAHAVHVFARNLRSKLLAAPLRGKRVLAIDPGFRTGCKLAALDETGNLLDDGVVYPHSGTNKRNDAKTRLVEMICRHQTPIIAIGNGSGCRETEELVSEVIANVEGIACGEVSSPPPVPNPAPVPPPEPSPLNLRRFPIRSRRRFPIRSRRRLRSRNRPSAKHPRHPLPLSNRRPLKLSRPRHRRPRRRPLHHQHPRRLRRRRLNRCRRRPPTSPTSSSMRPAPASIRPAPWVVRNFQTSTPRCAAQSPSAAGCKIRSANW
jgi:hypothetical protein